MSSAKNKRFSILSLKQQDILEKMFTGQWEVYYPVDRPRKMLGAWMMYVGPDEFQLSRDIPMASIEALLRNGYVDFTESVNGSVRVVITPDGHGLVERSVKSREEVASLKSGRPRRGLYYTLMEER